MKPLYLIPLIIITACSTEITEPSINLRSVDYIIYNPLAPCIGQEVTITFNNGYNNNCGVSRIQQRINDVWKVVYEDTPQDGKIKYSFTPPSSGSYRFRGSWNKTGKNCPGENIKPVEEEPLYVVDNCCRDFFTATAVCDSRGDCPYAVELHLMTSVENWIAIIGKLPEGYEFCGLYDEYGNIIEDITGNLIQIVADYPACTEGIFFAYFNGPGRPQSFGSWMVKDMQDVLYQVQVEPCLF